MSSIPVLKFPVESPIACRGGDADFYGSIQRLITRRTLVPTEPEWLDPQLLLQRRQDSIKRAARDLLRAEGIRLDTTAAITIYRHCREHGGAPQVERLALLAIQHAGSELIPVVPTKTPELDEHLTARLWRADVPSTQFYPAYCAPLHTDDEAFNPITHVLTLPVPPHIGGEAGTALRGNGLEIITPADQLK